METSAHKFDSLVVVQHILMRKLRAVCAFDIAVSGGYQQCTRDSDMQNKYEQQVKNDLQHPQDIGVESPLASEGKKRSTET